MYKIKFLLLAGIFSLLSVSVNAQMLGIKTNILHDALTAANLGFELVTGEHSSVDIQFSTTVGDPFGKEMSITMVQPEYRFWYAGRPMTRGFIGFAATMVQYDAKWKKTCYDGYAGGFGLSFGYVFHLNKRMNIEANAGVGAYYTHHKVNQVPKGDELYSNEYHNALQFLPSKVGLSFVYILK